MPGKSPEPPKPHVRICGHAYDGSWAGPIEVEADSLTVMHRPRDFLELKHIKTVVWIETLKTGSSGGGND
jgi:hypothetical protein